MKKCIVFFMLFALITGSAFADLLEGLTLYAWGKGDFVPFKYMNQTIDGVVVPDSGQTLAGAGIAWGGMRPDFKFALKGEYDYVGFDMSFDFSVDEWNENDFLTGDASAWIKPFGNNYLTIRLGKFEDTSLAGKIGAVNYGFEYFSMYGDVKEDDQLFSRFSTYDARRKNHIGGAGFKDSSKSFDGVGVMLKSTPIKGLDIGILVDGSIYGVEWKRDDGARSNDVYRYVQAAAGYVINNFGHVRVQYIGGYMGSFNQNMIDDLAINSFEGAVIANNPVLMARKPARFEAAFAVSAIPKLFLELGAKIWMPITLETTDMEYSNGLDISLASRFRHETFDLRARLDVTRINAYSYRLEEWHYDSVGGRQTGSKAADRVIFDLRMSPNLAFEHFSLGLDIGCKFKTEQMDADGNGLDNAILELGTGIFLSKGFKGGSIRAGVAYTFDSIFLGNGRTQYNSEELKSSQVFQIPIMIEFSFM